MTEFEEFLGVTRPEIDRALDRVLPAESVAPIRLHEAMRYSVFAGGKRFRPALLLATSQRLSGSLDGLYEAASALELIHTFSLVHDDLPALDDDALRRGQATVHVQYDEALAVLVGDALLGLGLEVLTLFPQTVSAEVRLRSCSAVAGALGSIGMIGGQVDDLAAEAQDPSAHSPELLESIHRRKTGALLVASTRLAGFFSGSSEEEDAALSRFGELLGLIFQMVDDVLDIESDTETLGKTAGKDARASKLTYPHLYGLEQTRQMIQGAREEALSVSSSLSGTPEIHDSLIEFLVQRRN